MRFVNAWMLVLVLLVPVVGAFWTFLRARSEARLRRIVAPALQRRLLPGGASAVGTQPAGDGGEEPECGGGLRREPVDARG